MDSALACVHTGAWPEIWIGGQTKTKSQHLNI